jgi:hypothetical protein
MNVRDSKTQRNADVKRVHSRFGLRRRPQTGGTGGSSTGGGAYLGDFVPPGSGGLTGPGGLLFTSPAVIPEPGSLALLAIGGCSLLRYGCAPAVRTRQVPRQAHEQRDGRPHARSEPPSATGSRTGPNRSSRKIHSVRPH